jgi:hypothetical protein
VSWSGSDSGGAGIATYDVQRSVAGGAFSNLASGLTASSVATTLTPGAGARFQVRATDKAGNVGGWTTGPTLTSSLVQQGSSAISFGGTWTKVTGGSFSGGSARYASAKKASASYTFTGRGVAFVTSTRSTAGKVKIYLDGVLLITLDTHAGSTAYRKVVFARNFASSGQHTLKLVVKGTASHPRVYLDALEVLR